MLAERTGMPFTQSLTITFLERLLDGIVMVGLVAAPLVLPVHGWVLQSVHVAVPIFGIALLAVSLCAIAPYQMVSLTSRLTAGNEPTSSRWWPPDRAGPVGPPRCGAIPAAAWLSEVQEGQVGDLVRDVPSWRRTGCAPSVPCPVPVRRSTAAKPPADGGLYATDRRTGRVVGISATSTTS